MPLRPRALLELIVLAGCAGTIPARASLTTTRVASGLDRPIFVTAPRGDPRLFILEQRGLIRILESGSVLPTPFLDIDSLIVDISANDERGLLGLAFHPDFPDSPFFFVDYVSNSNQTIIARYRVSGGDPDRADHSSAEIRMTIAQPFANHKGGTLAFGPDRYLWIGTGDGGSAGDPGNRAQSLNQVLGKILRIDVINGFPYAIPPDNPYFGNPSVRQEIWDRGLRNPYRWSFDRDTWDLWIGDVGQGLWEEIDFEPVGSGGARNYGWRLMEGNHCYNPPAGCETLTTVVRPIHEYDHGSGCAVTGGYVYRGSAIPGLQGAYFFADFCSAKIWSLRYDGYTVTDFRERTGELAPGGGMTIDAIAAIGQDGLGELYLVDRDDVSGGEIFKIVGTETGVEPAALGFRFGSFRPNPFRTSTSFELILDRPGKLDVEVVSVTGRLVARLASGAHDAATYVFTWDGRDRDGRQTSAGVYVLRVALDGRSESRRLSLVR